MNESKQTAIIGLVFAAIVGTGLHMWFAPQPVISYTRSVNTIDIKSGGKVIIRGRTERASKCSSLVFRQLISSDGRIVFFEPRYYPPRPVGITEATVDFDAPTSLSDGPMIYRVYVQFQCNFVQRWFGGSTLILPDIIFNYRST